MKLIVETRDIVNASLLKELIISRSQHSQDDLEIAQCLERKSYGYLIKSVNCIVQGSLVSAWKMWQLPRPFINWFLSKLGQQPNSQITVHRLLNFLGLAWGKIVRIVIMQIFILKALVESN